MSDMQMLWMSLALAALGSLLIWWGAFAWEPLLWLGLLLFAVAMLLGPATRYAGEDDSREGRES